MCDHPNREAAMTVIADGVWCDPCLAPIVAALNAGGVPTIASCCGHGRRLGSITLTDGRWLVVAPDVGAAEGLSNEPTGVAGVDFPADQEAAADELSRLGQQQGDGPNPLALGDIRVSGGLVAIRVDARACRIMWEPGCTTYHGGHECHHGDGHDGPHTCPCGATTENGAQPSGETP